MATQYSSSGTQTESTINPTITSSSPAPCPAPCPTSSSGCVNFHQCWPLIALRVANDSGR
eukprot:10828994-Lingulodinium_polyedra.AAC.1